MVANLAVAVSCAFSYIVTHKCFHLDEVFAALLLELFGGDRFDGIGSIPVVFVSAGSPPEEQYQGEDSVLIGFGGMSDEHRFDEHPTDGMGKKAKSASQLVVDRLDLGWNKAVCEMLEYVNRVDSSATAQPFDLPSMMKAFHDHNPDEEKKLWKLVKIFLLAKLLELHLLHDDPSAHSALQTVVGSKAFCDSCLTFANSADKAAECLSKEAVLVKKKGKLQPFHLAAILDCVAMMVPDKTSEIARGARLLVEAKWWEQHHFHECAKEWPNRKQDWLQATPKNILVVGIKSDNSQIWRWARANHNCGILVRMNSAGQVQILTDKKFGFDLSQVIVLLRTEEQKSAGETVSADQDMLASEGKIAGAASVWYYYKSEDGACAIFNGSSQSSPDTPPTKIPFEQILDIVYNHVSY